MRVILMVLILLLGQASLAADNAATKAFTRAQEFAHSAKNNIANHLNEKAGQDNLPFYTEHAPESQHFQNGRSAIHRVGHSKQTICQTQRAPNGFAQQECDVVNFLSKNPTTRKKFTLDKNTDPLLVESQRIINQPNVAGTQQQHCRIQKTTHPATFFTETCTQSMTLSEVDCHIHYDITTYQVHEIKQGQSCVSFKGVGVPEGSYLGPTEKYGLAQARQATAYLDQGYDQLFVQGRALGSYTAWQKENCYIDTSYGVTAATGIGTLRGVLAIWKDAGGYIKPGNSCSPLERVGYGVTINLCKTGCANYQKTWVCGGPHQRECNWAYTCNNDGTSVCPAGWRDINGVCREALYDDLLAQHCTLAYSSPNVLVPDGSDTIHYFYCTQQVDECRSFTERRQ